MRVPVFIFIGGGFVLACLPGAANAQETPTAPDMRQLLSIQVKQHFAPPATPHEEAKSAHDPEVLTLPPFLVNAPVLRVPSPADTVRPVIGFVRAVSYTEYAAQDRKKQGQMHDLLDLANLAQHSGDGAVAEKIRRETYRALVRDPTPLERAMDRSVNGGRY